MVCNYTSMGIALVHIQTTRPKSQLWESSILPYIMN